MRANTIAVLAVIGLLTGCAEREQWTGIVYPVPGSLLTDVKIGAFATFNDCAYASRILIGHITPEGPQAAFECGLNCSAQQNGMLLCEETRD